MESSTLPVVWRQRLWLIALVLLIYVFLLAPLVVTVVVSFTGGRTLRFPPDSWSLRWYAELWSNPNWRRPMLTSLATASLTAVFVTPLAVLSAYAMRQMGRGLSGALRLVLLLPQIVPVVLLGVGIFFLYARLGLLNTMPGIVLSHCMFALPFALLPMIAAFDRYDFGQVRAARSLGASAATAFRTVTLPQVKASVVVAAMFAFAASLEEAVIGLLISGGDNTLLSKRIFVSLRDQLEPTVAAVSTVMLGITLAGGLLALALRRAGGPRKARS